MKGIEFPNAISTPLGIIENTFSNELQIYPNPTTGLINLSLQRSYRNATIEISNTNGQTVYNQNYNELKDLNLDLSHLDTGVYIVKVHVKDKSATIKLIKK
jgi:hypothetical protein